MNKLRLEGCYMSFADFLRGMPPNTKQMEDEKGFLQYADRTINTLLSRLKDECVNAAKQGKRNASVSSRTIAYRLNFNFWSNYDAILKKEFFQKVDSYCKSLGLKLINLRTITDTSDGGPAEFGISISVKW